MTDNLGKKLDSMTLSQLKFYYVDALLKNKHLRWGAGMLFFACVFLIATICGILYASINLSFGFQWGAL